MTDRLLDLAAVHAVRTGWPVAFVDHVIREMILIGVPPSRVLAQVTECDHDGLATLSEAVVIAGRRAWGEPAAAQLGIRFERTWAGRELAALETFGEVLAGS